MPYDSATYTPAALAPAPYAPPSPEAFWNATPAQRRIMLAELLEHEDKLPLRFDLSVYEAACGTFGCAIGSADRLWGTKTLAIRDIRRAPRVFGLSTGAACDIFGSGISAYGIPDREVTPGMVAAKLRAYQQES